MNHKPTGLERVAKTRSFGGRALTMAAVGAAKTSAAYAHHATEREPFVTLLVPFGGLESSRSWFGVMTQVEESHIVTTPHVRAQHIQNSL